MENERRTTAKGTTVRLEVSTWRGGPLEGGNFRAMPTEQLRRVAGLDSGGMRRFHLFRLVLLLLSTALGIAGPALAQDLPSFGGSAATKASASQGDSERVRVSLQLSTRQVSAGGRFAAAITLDFDKGWHAWPALEQDVLPPEIAEFAIRTSVELEDVSGVLRGGATQWPAPSPAPVPDINNPGKSVEVPLYKDRAVVFFPLQAEANGKPGPRVLRFRVEYQACDETQCLIPSDVVVEASIDVIEGIGDEGIAIAPDQAEHFKPLDRSIFGATPAIPVARAAPPSTANPVGSTFFGVSLASLDGPVGFIAIALLGALGGFILNLTPCVLPVIPIKVLTLTRHAGSPRHSLILGIWMSLGVIAFWLALGVPAAFVSAWADPSRLFGIWWLTLGIGVAIGAMGLGIMGLFAINLPQSVYLVNPEADTPLGSFLFGVMTAVLGLPCFGFVAGALLPAAAAFGPATTVVVFASMGVGMALPYLVLAAKPSLVERLPRTGPGSELVKQVMGFLLLAAAAYFVGAGTIALVQDHPYMAKLLHWWVVALFGLISGMWLTYRTYRITKDITKRLLFGALGVVIAAAGVFGVMRLTETARHEFETGTWIPYSEALAARALTEKKVLVLDFTAEWCLNCKALKAAVLDSESVKAALSSNDVVVMEVDLTSRKAPGWAKLTALGQTGIPLLVIQGPGLPQPWLSNAYTSEQVLAAMTQARGPK